MLKRSKEVVEGYLSIDCECTCKYQEGVNMLFFPVILRQADGRKVLRSSIREFLCSEAMFFLGVPTTRAGSLVTSDSKVVRDIFYDGHPRHERCSVVLRIAPTFLR